jgi:hypothetical protein
MGVEYYTTRFLLQARANGLQFGKTLTIGRQNVQLTPRDLGRLAREFEFPSWELTSIKEKSLLTYIEPILTILLKALSVESIDVSNYESATHVHDLNTPLPEKFHGQFDTLLEAGSLEHIFNLPIALKNLMQAVKVGGTIFIQTPANNYFGHGFYQFSPELFYRVFSDENGFQVKRMHLFEHFFPCFFFATREYAVADPAKVGRRVQLVNNRPALLLIEARRTADKPIFAKTPLQSDYVPLWETSKSQMPTEAEGPVMLRPRWQHLLYALPLKLVGRLPLQYWLARGNKPALSNRDFFKPAP